MCLSAPDSVDRWCGDSHKGIAVTEDSLWILFPVCESAGFQLGLIAETAYHELSSVRVRWKSMNLDTQVPWVPRRTEDAGNGDAYQVRTITPVNRGICTRTRLQRVLRVHSLRSSGCPDLLGITGHQGAPIARGGGWSTEEAACSRAAWKVHGLGSGLLGASDLMKRPRPNQAVYHSGSTDSCR